MREFLLMYYSHVHTTYNDEFDPNVLFKVIVSLHKPYKLKHQVDATPTEDPD